MSVSSAIISFVNRQLFICLPLSFTPRRPPLKSNLINFWTRFRHTRQAVTLSSSRVHSNVYKSFLAPSTITSEFRLSIAAPTRERLQQLMKIKFAFLSRHHCCTVLNHQLTAWSINGFRQEVFKLHRTSVHCHGTWKERGYLLEALSSKCGTKSWAMMKRKSHPMVR